ncbi:MAG TPA: Hsp70 family protein, partial [Polyangiaceae bacterium]
ELFDVGGEVVDVDVALPRSVLDELSSPLVDRSITVCRRLLTAHGSPRLARIVLVGGPTAMPVLRGRVTEALQAPFREGLDPMTLVAQGAALYAATAHLEARPKAKEPAPQGPRVWLQYPAMTPDLTPFAVGKVLDAAEAKIAQVTVKRSDGEWAAPPEPLDAEGAFAVQLNLAPRKPNTFLAFGTRASGEVVALSPPSFTVVHGITIQDPPLSRSIGVALANDNVQLFFERGSPLPMRRTFTLRTVETVSRGLEGFALRVPIVQGEFPSAHLCRLVGALEIPSSGVKATLPAGSPVEVTLELDRGGRLSATARVPVLDQAFDQIAHLVAPHVPAPELAARAEALRTRAATVQSEALKHGMGARAIAKLGDLHQSFDDLTRDIERAQGGDADAAEKARRTLLEIDAAIGDIDAELAWPSLEGDVREEVAWATSWLAEFGTDDERKVLKETCAAVEKARVARDPREIERQLRVVRRLGWGAYYRSPGAWEAQFALAESRVADSSNLRRATELVNEGKRALVRGDKRSLEAVVRALWDVLPADAAERKLGYSSGVR